MLTLAHFGILLAVSFVASVSVQLIHGLKEEK